jgi:hypothetical protein
MSRMGVVGREKGDGLMESDRKTNNQTGQDL